MMLQNHRDGFASLTMGQKTGAALASLALIWFVRVMLSGDDMTAPGAPTVNTQVFQSIYSEGGWGNLGNGSGSGSTMAATKRARLIVELLVTKYDVAAMVDVPCGGMTWMPHVVERIRMSRPKFKYLGLDVVPTVIETNTKRFKKLPHYKFKVLDMAQQKLPKGYDLVWSRDALQHLPYEFIIGAIENFSKSSAKYLAVGSYLDGSNADISIGAYFSIDLRKEPFSMDKPVDIIEEEAEEENELKAEKVVLVYPISYLRKLNFKQMRKRAGIK